LEKNNPENYFSIQGLQLFSSKRKVDKKNLSLPLKKRQKNLGTRDAPKFL